MDSLNSTDEVERLVASFYHDQYQKFTLIKNRDDYQDYKRRFRGRDFCRRIADSLGISQSFYKADFDNNGLTDLLAIGKYYDFNISVLMNYGPDSLVLNRLTRRNFQECTFPKITMDAVIKYYYMSQPQWLEKKKQTLQQKDLVFKFGDFIEMNSTPKAYEITKIEYQTGMCFGTCPAFSLEINKDRKAKFKAEYYNRKTKNSEEIKGTFKTVIQEKAYSTITDLLNYIDFPTLEGNYSVNWTDDQTCTLKVTYNHGQVKEIKDYGLLGTYGLDRLYQLFHELRFNQTWK